MWEKARGGCRVAISCSSMYLKVYANSDYGVADCNKW